MEILVLVLSYLLGAISFGYLIPRWVMETLEYLYGYPRWSRRVGNGMVE